MGELKRLALNFRAWLEKCQQVLDHNDRPAGHLPSFQLEQFFTELNLVTVNDKRGGLDPEPLLAGLASIIRRHNKRVAGAMATHSVPQANVTVNRMNLLKQSHFGQLEAGILELLCKAGIANSLSRLREKRGISLRQLEQQSGVSFSYLSQIERLSGSLPSPEILAKLDSALSSPNWESGISLLRQRGEYDNAVQLLQQEDARLEGFWLQLMGGSSLQDTTVKRSLSGREREAVKNAERTNSVTPMAGDAEPGWKRPSASNTNIDIGHDDTLYDGYEDNNSGEDNIEGEYGDVLSVIRAQEPGVLTFELCDYFVELNPGMQKAVLHLVKDLAKFSKGR